MPDAAPGQRAEAEPLYREALAECATIEIITGLIAERDEARDMAAKERKP